jgi:hypothetical protein
MGIFVNHARWLVLTVCAACAATAQAADINKAPGGDKPLVIIEGAINNGDCNKLLVLIRKSFVKAVYLASPGGNVLEAMRIGRLVRALKLETIVPVKREGELRTQQAANFGIKNPDDNLVCASACFFVFAAGVLRNQDYRFGSPLLGIHRPYLSESDLKSLSVDRALETATRTRAIVENYLKEMNVRPFYTDQMFLIPKEQMYWVPVTQFRAELEGLLPELKEWINANAQRVLDLMKQTDTSDFPARAVEFDKFLKETLSDPTRREAFVLDDLQFNSWQKLIGASFSPSIFDIPGTPQDIPNTNKPFCKN